MAASVDWYWTDLICPKNYQNRKVIMLYSTKLVTILDGDFHHTNELINCFRENLSYEMMHQIALNPAMTVADNCMVLVHCLEKLDGHLKSKHEQLEDLMDAGLYKDLMETKTSFVTKIKTARKASKNAVSAVGSVPGMVVISLLCEENYIQSLINSLNAMARTEFGRMTIQSLSDSPQVIINRMKAQNNQPGDPTVDDLVTDIEVNLDKFDQASYTFRRAVDRVIVRIDG